MTTLALLAYLAIQHREAIKDTVVDIADNFKDGFKKNKNESSNYKNLYGLNLPKKIVNNTSLYAASNQKSTLSEDIIHISLTRTKKKINKFSVIIDGGFGCGKHTLVNALMGRHISGAAFAPHPLKTGIVIYFGYDDEKVIIHHMNGTTEEWSLDDYYSIKITNKYTEDYEYIEYRVKGNDVEKQLQFTLIPSYSYDVFSAEAYANADAVIYCMDAINFMPKSEEDYFKRRGFGKTIKNVYFAINHWDSIEENEKDMAKRHFENKILNVCFDNDGKADKAFVNKHIFYVNARGAESLRVNGNYKVYVAGKEVEVPIDIEETGIPALEKALAEYMAENY